MSHKYRSTRRSTTVKALLLAVAAAALSPGTLARAFAGAQPPAAPTHLAAHAITRTSLALSWRRSTGPGRVVRYRIYRNGRKIGHTRKTGFAVSGLRCGMTSLFSVRAVTAAGRTSRAAERSVRTAACAAPDTQPP